MNNLAGFFLTFVAGASVGMSMWPLKWVRGLKWENFWLLYSIFSLIVLPFALAFAVLPPLTAVYASLTLKQILQPFFTFLGSLGISIGYAVFMIAMIISGQFASLMTGEWHSMSQRTYRPFSLGVGLLVAAVLAIGTSKYLEAQ